MILKSEYSMKIKVILLSLLFLSGISVFLLTTSHYFGLPGATINFLADSRANNDKAKTASVRDNLNADKRKALDAGPEAAAPIKEKPEMVGKAKLQAAADKFSTGDKPNRSVVSRIPGLRSNGFITAASPAAKPTPGPSQKAPVVFKQGTVASPKAPTTPPASKIITAPVYTPKPSAAGKPQTGSNPYLIPWFNNAEKIFSLGKQAVVYDIDSGLSFNIKRTYGYNHADCETLTLQDTAVLKKIYGGSWSWVRRAVIVTVDGRRMAASMTGMPHAGIDSQQADIQVSSRSGNYGAGYNLDKIKNNGMDGHFDIHFQGSRTHGTNTVNQAHQDMVAKAARWALQAYR